MNINMKKYFDTMSSTINNSLWLIGFNIIPIILFVLFFMIFNIFGVITIIDVMSSIALFFSHTKYVGPDNLISLLLFPPNWIIILISLILFSFFAIFEMSGLIYACTSSMYNKKTSFTKIILKSIKSSERSLFFKNWAIILFVIIIFPLASFISLSSATFCLKVPEFISDFLLANKIYGVLYILLHIIIFILEIRYVFAFYYYTMKEDDFIEACKKSKNITNKHYLEIITSVIIMAIIFFVISTSISAIISETIYTLTSHGVLFTRSTFTQDFQILFKNFLYAVISPVFNVACLTVLFFKYHNHKELDISHDTIPTDGTKAKLGKMIWLIIFCIIFGAFQIVLNAHTLFPKNTTLHIPNIVAHRGDSVRAPENTMPAIELAVEEENPYIEFDVHQTKDNVIIVSHDDNLLRVTGEDVYVHELTYEEIQKLDTGKWFNERYKGTKFTTLDEVLKFLRPHDITIQIEIKPTGFDPGLEQNVVSIIKQNDMVDRCMITCLKLPPLLNIERFAPEIYTVYSMFIASKNIETIPVDAYTIEANNVYETLVENVHNAGKKIFAWTVNTEGKVQNLVDYGVDGILTDDPIMMANALYKCDYEGGIKKAIRTYLSILINGL